VAHEINNPIGFVSSNLGTLSTYVQQMLALLDAYAHSRSALPPAMRARIEALPAQAELEFMRQDLPDLLKDCREGLGRVKRIVSDLRTFTHIDAAGWAPADLNAALESALNVVGNALKDKAEVHRELAPLPPVTCIVAQLGQVFVNLLMNAAQAIDTRGTITLRSGAATDSVWIEICDTGPGIPAEVQKRIFEPFYTTKPVGQGTGLGLSIAWEIIAQHQGKLEVHSSPGQDTRFRITLPLAPTL
jgi:signal transduction histidine kinase